MPLDVNKNRKQLKHLIYFVDRSLPKRSLLKELRQKGCTVKHHDELFVPDASDVEWLRVAGKNNWLVLSHDRNIGRNPLEIEMLRRAKVKAFMPSSKGSLSGAEITNIIIKAIPAIERFARANKPPFIAKIYQDGAVKKWK
jgi:predicted nuclease of predicted toxin-antitoxin system